MKIEYVKPSIEFEDFELNADIAVGCKVTVNLGPYAPGINPCDEYSQPESIRPAYGIMGSTPTDLTFYEGSCSCYLSSVGSTLLTS